MLDVNELAEILHSIATSYLDRAREVIETSENIEPGDHGALLMVIDDREIESADKCRLFGDVLRSMGYPQPMSNECYRAAFYLGNEQLTLIDNPLFGYFRSNNSGKILDKWIHYFEIYHRYFEPFRERQVRILEIGVYRGGSLDMWQWYFGDDAVVIGADIDPGAAELADPRFLVEIGDQSDPEFLKSLGEKHGPFDIIIDDGGHVMTQQIASIENLMPYLNGDGIYMVEDCHTSYWSDFGGGWGERGSFIEWSKDRLDDLHKYHTNDPVDDMWTRSIKGISFFDSVVVFEKSKRHAPFCEQMGSSNFLFMSRTMSSILSELVTTRDSAMRNLEELRVEISGSTVEALRQSQADLRQAHDRLVVVESGLNEHQNELAIVQNQLKEARLQTKSMRHSISWKLTFPLRALRRRGQRRRAN